VFGTGLEDRDAEALTGEKRASEARRDVAVCIELASLDADSGGDRSAEVDVVDARPRESIELGDGAIEVIEALERTDGVHVVGVCARWDGELLALVARKALAIAVANLVGDRRWSSAEVVVELADEDASGRRKKEQ
jgi:hypothetical protein